MLPILTTLNIINSLFL